MSAYDQWSLCYLQCKVCNWWTLTDDLIPSSQLIHHHLSWWQQQAVTVTLTTKLFRATALVTTTRLHPAQVSRQHCVLPRILLTDMIHMLTHPVLHESKKEAGLTCVIYYWIYIRKSAIWDARNFLKCQNLVFLSLKQQESSCTGELCLLFALAGEQLLSDDMTLPADRWLPFWP